ncbi:coiled-coil domain-containing protein-domain-containing protein, partial [Neohortaea acidophila]
RIKNRRQRYLDLHPEYFKESSLELADPLLYDRLIRRFQTAAERESEGRLRGYSGILEANLVRSEAKLEALDHPDPNNPLIYRWSKWEEIMGLRFLRGDDADFDYATVDENDEYDHRDDED